MPRTEALCHAFNSIFNSINCFVISIYFHERVFFYIHSLLEVELSSSFYTAFTVLLVVNKINFYRLTHRIESTINSPLAKVGFLFDRGGSRGVGSWGPPNFIKREKTLRVLTRKRRF